MNIQTINSTISNLTKKSAIMAAVTIPTLGMLSGCAPVYYNGPHFRNEFYHPDPLPPKPIMRPVPGPQLQNNHRGFHADNNAENIQAKTIDFWG